MKYKNKLKWTVEHRYTNIKSDVNWKGTISDRHEKHQRKTKKHQNNDKEKNRNCYKLSCATMALPTVKLKLNEMAWKQRKKKQILWPIFAPASSICPFLSIKIHSFRKKTFVWYFNRTFGNYSFFQKFQSTNTSKKCAQLSRSKWWFFRFVLFCSRARRYCSSHKSILQWNSLSVVWSVPMCATTLTAS